jgi:TPR repeat protein
MYGLGKCYYNGYGVKKDLAEAKKWLTKAANKGHRASKKLLEEIER